MLMVLPPGDYVKMLGIAVDLGRSPGERHIPLKRYMVWCLPPPLLEIGDLLVCRDPYVIVLEFEQQSLMCDNSKPCYDKSKMVRYN